MNCTLCTSILQRSVTAATQVFSPSEAVWCNAASDAENALTGLGCRPALLDKMSVHQIMCYQHPSNIIVLHLLLSFNVIHHRYYPRRLVFTIDSTICVFRTMYVHSLRRRETASLLVILHVRGSVISRCLWLEATSVSWCSLPLTDKIFMHYVNLLRLYRMRNFHSSSS